MKTLSKKTPCRTLRRQAGSFLLEALIGMTLFSIGLLALVRTQAFAVTATTEGKYRLDAAMLASQVVSELWVAGTASNVASYAGTYSDTSTTWGRRVAYALPGGSVNVALNGAEVTVTVAWQVPGENVRRTLAQVASVQPDSER
jgi:type IV pilus assembly protein PilV